MWRAAPRGWYILLESRCSCVSSSAVRTTPAAVFGRGFPSLSKEGSARAEPDDGASKSATHPTGSHRGVSGGSENIILAKLNPANYSKSLHP
jgi:hypothetical protein